MAGKTLFFDAFSSIVCCKCLQILLGPVGLEPTDDPCKHNDLQKTIDEKAPKSADLGANSKQIPPELALDLAEMVAVWPKLPEYIKAAIRALIQAHNTENE